MLERIGVVSDARVQARRRRHAVATHSPVSVHIDTPRATGTADIRARVRLWDREVLPEPGSYVAELGSEGLATTAEPDGGSDVVELDERSLFAGG
ncbi:hypothetical protein [Nocardia sp. NPDC046763]|uniref:hypothetical protein n=1 Tax=Nocardia sp. NPDC046763 TaxID=3155256 RepID=UPI0033CDC33F